MIFNSSGIKLVSEDFKSVVADYGYLYEQATEFVLSGIIHLDKKELNSEEIEFLSEMCKKQRCRKLDIPQSDVNARVEIEKYPTVTDWEVRTNFKDE